MTDTYGEFYAHRAPGPWRARALRCWHQRLVALAAPWIGRRVLELGPGHWFAADALVARGCRWQGVEQCEAGAAALRARGLECLTATVPPLPDGPAADTVWLSHVLEHCGSPAEARALVVACAERLAPGGSLVVVAPDIVSWGAQFWALDWSHGYPTASERIRQLLHEAGLDVVSACTHAFGVPGAAGTVLAALYGAVPFAPADALTRGLWRGLGATWGWRQVLVIGRRP